MKTILNNSKLKDKLQFFYDLHDIGVNQTYGGIHKLPYSFHLKMTVKNAIHFNKCLSTEVDRIKLLYDVMIACAGHDSIEDARLTYNEIKDEFGVTIADIIFYCTDMRGKNRVERHNDDYFRGLYNNKLALFVKLCDLIANVEFGVLTKSSMFEKYKDEYGKFKYELYYEPYEPMFNRLEKLFDL